MEGTVLSSPVGREEHRVAEMRHGAMDAFPGWVRTTRLA